MNNDYKRVLWKNWFQLWERIKQIRQWGAGEAFCAEVFKGSELCGIKRGSGGALPPLQHGRDDDGVALGAAGDELHIGLRAGAGGADLLAGAGAVGVGAVAGDLFKVGLGQLLQNGGKKSV